MVPELRYDLYIALIVAQTCFSLMPAYNYYRTNITQRLNGRLAATSCFSNQGEGMSMADEKRGGGCRKGQKGTCTGCGDVEMPGYWCDVCEREVTEKRCPFCGLKARKLREER